jgi:hypothetical protein
VARRLHWRVGIMEVAIAIIVLAVGLMLERSQGTAQPVRVRSSHRR